MPPRGQFAEVHRQVHAAVGRVDDLLPGQNVEVNGGVLGDKVADARQQQALHQRGVRIEGQCPRQLAILDVQNFRFSVLKELSSAHCMRSPSGVRVILR